MKSLQTDHGYRGCTSQGRKMSRPAKVPASDICPDLYGLYGVSGLAEMELVFPIATVIVLCFVLVARKVLITLQCFGYC